MEGPDQFGHLGLKRGGVRDVGLPGLVSCGVEGPSHVFEHGGLKAGETLLVHVATSGIGTRLVSLPSWELFGEQDAEYRASVLPAGLVKVAIEAASPMGWERYIGSDGAFVGMTGYGASAPYQELYRHFGLTPEAVVAAAKARL